MDVRGCNQRAWDRQVALGNRWTVPVGPEVIAAAREGRWDVIERRVCVSEGRWDYRLERYEVSGHEEETLLDLRF